MPALIEIAWTIIMATPDASTKPAPIMIIRIIFRSIETRVFEIALESHGTLASGFHNHNVPKAAPTTITCPTIPGNLEIDSSGDKMSFCCCCCSWPATPPCCCTLVPTPNTKVSSTTWPSTADSTLVVTVYSPSGRLG
jgi:hypothetical protein